MCGIIGFCEPRRCHDANELEEMAQTMAATLSHRGPDDQGVWTDPDVGLALGHRRLSILDLSPHGHQPMASADGRFVLVFNGEIYNCPMLRRTLEQAGHAFRGHSDTEVMVEAISEWGLSRTLRRLVGMFAFGLWDRKTRHLYLARDRAGEKPLYYGWAGRVFLFGSELKALRAHPAWRAEIDRGALALLTRYGYVPGPRCIYQGISKLTPGTVVTLSEEQISRRELTDPEPYWDLGLIAEARTAHRFTGTEAEADQWLHSLLLESVALQMVADVPLGAFLSGGIDSSLVVALMQAQSARPVKTFSIGFDQAEFDEAPYAKAVARHLGTDHTEYYVQPGELEQVIPELPRVYDEPLADPSQIPTVLLCRLAGTQVKVSLSGDAGDELFGGYDHYRRMQKFWRAFRRIPSSLRKGCAEHLRNVCRGGLDRVIKPGKLRQLFNRAVNLSDMLGASTDLQLFQTQVSPNREAFTWLKDAEESPSQFSAPRSWERLPGLLDRMMWLDFITYLADDILVKVDRAAMAASLETRIPMLDHRIIEFAWSLPSSFKQKRNKGKWPLRKILYQYLPRGLFERPKKGFAAPIAEWLRGPLLDWAEHILDAGRLRHEGFFETTRVRQRWSEHTRMKRDWSHGLWHVLMFQSWLEQQRKAPAKAERPWIQTAQGLPTQGICQL
jgi:asparagine synthase (glutamine-hydrolysing)